jgi:hypothetical protein
VVALRKQAGQGGVAEAKPAVDGHLVEHPLRLSHGVDELTLTVTDWSAWRCSRPKGQVSQGVGSCSQESG